MFTSKEDLKLSYGIDMEIGRFFVDRKVPADNSYWKNRYLYINPMPGYLFIPLYADLQHRLGISKKDLFSETHLQVVEKILDCIGKEEFTGQTHEQHVDECIEVVQHDCKNKSFLEELKLYFKGQPTKGIQIGTELKALNRVDTYLFTLCCFDFDAAVKQQLVDAWHALMNFYLITDDLDDIKDDFETKEHNAIIEAGLSDEGADKIESVLHHSYNIMNRINPVFANRMDYSIQQINVKQIIDLYLSGEAPKP